MDVGRDVFSDQVTMHWYARNTLLANHDKHAKQLLFDVRDQTK
jgi:hypothetical protein